MKIAVVVKSDVIANSNYRGLMLVNCLRERGHEVPWYGSEHDVLPLDVFATCDVIHMYRVVDVSFLRTLRRLQARGVALTWDNDDDIEALDEGAPNYDTLGGKSAVRDFVIQRHVIRQADAITTTSELLAEKYRRAGGKHVAVIENYLPREFVRARRRRHRGVIVGWVGAGEHVVDAEKLNVAETVQRVLAARSNVRVATLGAQPLSLRHDRYEHRPYAAFGQLVSVISDFDIGIAPLADIPFNRNRSNVKLKEYGAAGIPWLASPVGEYRRLGAEQGGRLVADDEWAEAIISLATHPVQRLVLGRRAKRWAGEQELRVNIHRWEEVFEAAMERARRRATEVRREERRVSASRAAHGRRRTSTR